VYNYGPAYPNVLRYFDRNADGDGRCSDHRAVLRAEVLHGIRDEMAEKLGDVIFRRTDLGTAGNPGDTCLSACAAVMAKELRWNETKIQRELEEIRAVFPK